MSAAARRLTIEAPSVKARPLAERGRMLFVDDVVALFGGRKGRWWVSQKFAPEHRRKLGRDSYWYENEVTDWLDKQGTK